MKLPKYSKLVVAGVIVLNTVFAVAVLYIFLRTEQEPKTLIGAWFAFTTAELWSLAGIKRAEIKTESGKEKEGTERDM